MDPSPGKARRLEVVVFSPHPDDSDIGAGGFLHRLVRDGFGVTVYVMTSEPNAQVAARRRAEMLRAAAIVGIEPAPVVFVGFRDGSLPAVDDEAVERLNASGTQLKRLQRIVSKRPPPDLVLVNHHAERHSDHRGTRSMVENLFPGIPTLEYVVGNHVDLARFNPSVFVELDDELYDVKLRALAAHESQVEAGRIQLPWYDRIWRSFASEVRCDRVEPFEARNFNRAAYDMVSRFNAGYFHRLWLEVVDSGHLLVVHGHSRHLPHRQALDDLRFVFRTHSGLPRLTTAYADETSATAEDRLRSGDVLLVDGPASNALTARYLNRLRVRYRVTFSEPAPHDPQVRDSITGRAWKPQYITTMTGGRSVVNDFGVLTVLSNPFAARSALLAVAGTTAVGTAGLLQVLMRPTREVYELARDGVSVPGGAQAVFTIAADREGRLVCTAIEKHVGAVDLGGAAGL